VIRFNPPVRALYQRLTQAGRPGKLALTACMLLIPITSTLDL
jgi:hypothetical protein